MDMGVGNRKSVDRVGRDVSCSICKEQIENYSFPPNTNIKKIYLILHLLKEIIKSI